MLQPVLAEQAAADSKSNGAPVGSKDPGDLEALSLTDLNDTAILLRFIKEQAIYIYEEAARVSVSVNASPDYKPPTSIPVDLKVKKFLPARQQWLVFYVGTM